MIMKQRLIDIINDFDELDFAVPPDWWIEQLADHLLAKGVIVPPVEIGQTVWYIRDKDVVETRIEKIILKHGGLYMKLWCNSRYETTCRSIGKTVFLTKEEALQALEERSKHEKKID